ncbi:MAG: dihydropteroate synthase [Thermodesulfobacteriota bacterium]
MEGLAGHYVRLRDTVLDCSSKTLIMGILNVTPDSFSDGGRFYDKVRAVEHGVKLASDGADIIDVGGESTRPGSESIPVEEELRRVIPVISALVKEVEVPISVDTCKSEVAARAIEVGAAMVNDISALRFDPRMVHVVAENQVGLVLMHMKGTPRDMQMAPSYDDLLNDISSFLHGRMLWAQERGVAPDRIMVDPGIGFGKTVAHNLTILKGLSHFKTLGRPIVLGTSRKSFIGHVLQADVGHREEGTAATVAVGIWNGANVVRVHDVAGMAPVVKMTDAIMRAGGGAPRPPNLSRETPGP